METIDANTGEVTDSMPRTSQALDGNLIPSCALTGGSIIDMLEDGQFSQDMFAKVTEIAACMNDLGNASGQKMKGQLVITLDFVKEDNAFRIASKMKAKMPEPPRPRSIMWTDEHNRLTRFPPNQMQMFGLKSVGGAGPVRNV